MDQAESPISRDDSPVGFPVITSLRVSGYGLYPGLDGSGFTAHFEPGLTLIIGANGLGKSTLIQILFRLLVGPFDIARFDETREIGTARLDIAQMSPWGAGTFGRRVSDGASAATAAVQFSVGGHTYVVERSLGDLSLTSLQIDGEQRSASDSEEFQQAIVAHARLGTFADWILLLRNVVFYFEDRRALVWDTSAQRQILRLLFLPAEIANEWTRLEREILVTDSRMRNLQAAVRREERELSKLQVKVDSLEATRSELARVEADLEVDRATESAADDALHELEVQRAQSRVRRLEAAQVRDGRLRELERLKLVAVGAQFPSSSESAKYILAQLMAGEECLACGSTRPDIAKVLSDRVESGTCVVCGSRRKDDVTVPIDREITTRAIEALALAEREFADADQALSASNDEVIAKTEELVSIRESIARAEQRARILVAALPPDEAAVHERKTGLGLLASRVGEMKVELEAGRREFAKFLHGVSRTIVDRATEIKREFDRFATGFLVEECDLTWAPSYARVGQTGDAVPYPAFELRLGGSDFAAPILRSGPGEVSESQREFIDLSFRMALMAVAGFERAGTLVVDAPESSLDAVFSERAAAVLTDFASPSGPNRLVVTSNLVEGSLIPALARLALPVGERSTRLVDLLRLARPTAAVAGLSDQYDKVRQELLGS